ncbi:MAG: coproporphyrinogen III oxidase, partial [Alphaproteobacteria bacterium]
SLYQLTIEPDTVFARLEAAGKLAIPGDSLARALYEETQALCEAAGLPAYEISNHARPGEECRHNLVYWRMGDYAGIGPGAHGRLRSGGACHASATLRHPESWLEQVERQGHGLAEFVPLTREDVASEILIMGLRLAEGLDVRRYRAAGGTLRQDALAWLSEEGLVSWTPDRLTVTPAGRLVLNAVIAQLSARG